jgi:large subunit ribosomal protein L53
MLTKYLTSVTTAFSPFNPKSGKTARNFLALLPPTAHKTMTIDVKVLSQAQKVVPATLALKFSELLPINAPREGKRTAFLG